MIKWEYLSQQSAMQPHLDAPKTPPAAPTRQPRVHQNPPGCISPNSEGGEKESRKRWVVCCRRSTIHRVVCVCVCVGVGEVGVGAGPNGFIAPMKRPEKPNKSETWRRTKATERAWSLLQLHRFVLGYILTGNICKEEAQDPRLLWTRRCPVWKGHLRVSEGFRKRIEILLFYISFL